MATYKQIQKYVKAKYGFMPKTCWIADAKERVGLPVHRAWNSLRDDCEVPSFPEKVDSIMCAFRHFGMISTSSH